MISVLSNIEVAIAMRNAVWFAAVIHVFIFLRDTYIFLSFTFAFNTLFPLVIL